jgi:hypothetical protein
LEEAEAARAHLKKRRARVEVPQRSKATTSLGAATKQRSTNIIRSSSNAMIVHNRQRMIRLIRSSGKVSLARVTYICSY